MKLPASAVTPTDSSLVHIKSVQPTANGPVHSSSFVCTLQNENQPDIFLLSIRPTELHNLSRTQYHQDVIFCQALHEFVAWDWTYVWPWVVFPGTIPGTSRGKGSPNKYILRKLNLKMSEGEHRPLLRSDSSTESRNSQNEVQKIDMLVCYST